MEEALPEDMPPPDFFVDLFFLLDFFLDDFFFFEDFLDFFEDFFFFALAITDLQ